MLDDKYYLMNKDEKIGRLAFLNGKVYLDELYNNIDFHGITPYNWLLWRSTFGKRNNIYRALKLFDIKNNADLFDATHLVSLNDTIWVKNEYSNIEWDDISPYINKLDEGIAKLALTGDKSGINISKKVSPTFLLSGDKDKCWGNSGHGIVLHKRSNYIDSYVNQIASKLINDPKDYVVYRAYNDGYEVCDIFTDEITGYKPIGVTNYSKLSIPELDKRLDHKSRLRLRQMLVLDALTLNYGRDIMSYGFEVDNDDMTLVGIAPIFGSSHSLGIDISIENASNCEGPYNKLLSGTMPNSFKNHIEQARWAMTSDMRNNIKNMYPFKFNLELGSNELSKNRITFMEYIINTQIKRIFNLKS